MPSHHITDPRAHGAAILARFAKLSPAPSLKPLIKAFAAEHAAFEKAHAKDEQAKAARDAALAELSAADDALDAAVGTVADKLVGSGLTKRARPFAGFSTYSPTELSHLAYANEVKAYRSLAAAVRKQKKLPKDVTKALAACDKAASGVASALERFGPLASEYTRSVGTRDALLPSWTKALARLRRTAAAVWFDEPATYRAIFANADRVVAPRKKRTAKKTPKTPATTAA